MHSFFGIQVKLELKESKYKDNLINELIPYRTDHTSYTVLITDNWTDYPLKPTSNNPSQHFYSERSIHIKERLMDVAFVFSEEKILTHLFFKLNTAKTSSRKILRKWANMQFTNRVENIGQIFHENILIPLTFFFEHLTPIHAAGYILNNKTSLLAGTGGTGKTTLEMELCLHENAQFVTDDIGIIDLEGSLHPNYNNPKIYAYNLLDKSALKKRIFKNQSLLNKMHWFLHKSIFGISKARRKVNPFKLYKKVSTQKTKLDNYYVLLKNSITRFEKHTIRPEVAAQMNSVIMSTEYYYFFNHLKWHEFNALAAGKTPLITMTILEKRWKKNLEQILKSVEVTILQIPLKLEHKTFIKQGIAILKK